MMRSGNIFEREGSRGHGCDGDGTEITGGGDYSGWDKMYDQGSIETINEQISNFAQTYPTNLKASSNEALLFICLLYTSPSPRDS